MDTARDIPFPFIDASVVASALPIAAAVAALEEAFLAQARGEVGDSQSLGFSVPGGSFHVKTCGSAQALRGLFVAKVNANFPANPATRGLPTIQGVIAVFDARDGRVRAIVDSPSVTQLRTAAASALAIKHLARAGARTAAIIGCGVQGNANARALGAVMEVGEVRLYDAAPARAEALARELGGSGMSCRVVRSLDEAAQEADVVVTCTPATQPFLSRRHVTPGALVVALGADNEVKLEITPELLAAARLVTDATAQCLKIGELKQAPQLAASVCGEFTDVVAGRVPRVQPGEVLVFDSTGLAIQDLAMCAALVQAGVIPAA